MEMEFRMCGNVEIEMWRYVDVEMCRCGVVEMWMWRCVDVDVEMWRCEVV